MGVVREKGFVYISLGTTAQSQSMEQTLVLHDTYVACQSVVCQLIIDIFCYQECIVVYTYQAKDIQHQQAVL